MLFFSGIHPLTLLDYPQKISAIVFTPGCNMRCHFCHNSEFVLPEKIKKIEHDFIPETHILNFLNKRIGKLDGIVISGGEPTLHPSLLDFMRSVKKLGFLIKLDTNGTNPDVVQQALNEKLVDYIALDIKATFEKYEHIIGVKLQLENIQQTKNILQNSNIEYEFRTTVIKGFHSPEMLEKMFQSCKNAPKYTIQNYRNKNPLNPSWKKFCGFTSEELKNMQRTAQKYIKNVLVLENL